MGFCPKPALPLAKRSIAGISIKSSETIQIASLFAIIILIRNV